MRPTNNAAINPSPVIVEGAPPQGMGILRKPVGFNFFTTYGIALVAGRYFDEGVGDERHGDTARVGAALRINAEGTMLKNYTKVALGQLWRQRLYAFINIVGLAVGLAACVLIGLFVRDELSYDRFHPNAERIYRISRDYSASADFPGMRLATNAPQAASLLAGDFPQVEQATRIFAGFPMVVSRDDAMFYENRLRFADANLFDFFQFDWLQGSPQSALTRPNTVVLTSSLAQKYFGSDNPLGQDLKLGIGLVLEVTGVIRDLPDNTHLSADAFASVATLAARFGPEFMDNWASNNVYTYVLLRPGATIASLQAGLPAFYERHMDAVTRDISSMSATALTGIHLRGGDRQFPMQPPGSMVAVQAFSLVAICILLLACINFTNLSTARGIQRAREVGVRKALGASQWQMVWQFLAESAFSVLFALILAVVLVELTLGPFNALLGKHLGTEYLGDPLLWFMLFAGCLLVVLAAGAYPAFFLSAFHSAKVLRGDLSQGTGGAQLRNILAVLQFSVAIALLVATGVVYTQLHYARTIDLGYEQERIVVLDNVDERWSTLKNELLAYPGIVSATVSNMVPGTDNANALFTRFEGGSATGVGMQYLQVGYDFFSTYGIELLAGRDFSENRPTDQLVPPDEANSQGEGAFILSEMAVRQRGWTPESALGKWVEIGFDADYGESVRGLVIGVVPDIHFESVKVAMEPVVYFLPPPVMFGAPVLTSASLLLSGNDTEAVLRLIESKWAGIYPDRPLETRLLGEELNGLYLAEERQGEIFTDFALLALMIACMGIFGLAVFNAERRTKEVGVRKVMGGSVWSIVVLLTNDFSKLVLVSNLIAWPVAYVAMSHWLASFAYRIDLTPLVFIGSGAIALCIAWVTVGGIAARAASARPVLALRYE